MLGERLEALAASMETRTRFFFDFFLREFLRSFFPEEFPTRSANLLRLYNAFGELGKLSGRRAPILATRGAHLTFTLHAPGFPRQALKRSLRTNSRRRWVADEARACRLRHPNMAKPEVAVAIRYCPSLFARPKVLTFQRA